jgi:hypothetical protein
MNTLQLLFDHKKDIWAASVTVYLVISHAGGLRRIWANILGPKVADDSRPLVNNNPPADQASLAQPKETK